MDEKAKSCVSAEWRHAAPPLESAAQTGTAPFGAEGWDFERNIESKSLFSVFKKKNFYELNFPFNTDAIDMKKKSLLLNSSLWNCCYL